MTRHLKLLMSRAVVFAVAGRVQEESAYLDESAAFQRYLKLCSECRLCDEQLSKEDFSKWMRESNHQHFSIGDDDAGDDKIMYLFQVKGERMPGFNPALIELEEIPIFGTLYADIESLHAALNKFRNAPAMDVLKARSDAKECIALDAGSDDDFRVHFLSWA